MANHKVLCTKEELYYAFLSHENQIDIPKLRASFLIALELLESTGLIRHFTFGEWILLDPPIFDSYAASIVFAASDEPSGLGIISEEQVLSGNIFIPSDIKIVNREQEKLLIIAAIEDLLHHEIALREATPSGVFFVFPSQSTRTTPFSQEPEGKSIAFAFNGAVSNIFVTLAVRLSSSGIFKRKDIWQNAITFDAIGGGTCGLFLVHNGEGRGTLTLFFDPVTSEETRYYFDHFIARHLDRTAIPESVTRYRIIICPVCGILQPSQAVKRRQELGFTWLNCSVCDTHISLIDQMEHIIPVDTGFIGEMDRTADYRRDQETFQASLQGKRLAQDFDVFLCYDTQDKPAVKLIAEQLIERGILPWLDEWEIQPGISWVQSIAQIIGTVRSVAIFVGERGAIPWQHSKIESMLQQFSMQGRPLIPVILPGCKIIPTLPMFLRSLTLVDFRTYDRDPIGHLIWGITGKHDIREYMTESQDHNQIYLALHDDHFRNYKQLALAFCRYISARDPRIIHSPFHFQEGLLWEILLPHTGLSFQNERAILLLRQQEYDDGSYEIIDELCKVKAGCILIVDVQDIPTFPITIDSIVIRFNVLDLKKMLKIPKQDLTDWTKRFISRKVTKNAYPFVTQGPSKHFFGRREELRQLIGSQARGGIILGAHGAGKTCLLDEMEKQLKKRGSIVIGRLTSNTLQEFFERTLYEKLNLVAELDRSSPESMAESWAVAIRTYYRDQNVKPIFLIDEVDTLLQDDEGYNWILGRKIRSLNEEGFADFYFAGLSKLRLVSHLEENPWRHFEPVITLAGLEHVAASSLIQASMNDLGYTLADASIERIYQGTTGVAVLIVWFCKYLAEKRIQGLGRENIEEVDIIAIEENDEFLEQVLLHYFYGVRDFPLRKAILCMAAFSHTNDIGRQEIVDHFGQQGVYLMLQQLDDALNFLIQFGIIRRDTRDPNLYHLLSHYLYKAIQSHHPDETLQECIKLCQLGVWHIERKKYSYD